MNYDKKNLLNSYSQGIKYKIGKKFFSLFRNIMSFEGKKCLLETHIFDFDQEIYGEHLRVALVDFIRLEQKFDGIKDLKSQITVDQKSAKDILANEIKK